MSPLPFLLLSFFVAVGYTQNIWLSLNKSVNGNLHKIVPLSQPCFSSAFNYAACSSVQKNFTSPTYRTEVASAYMNLQSEMCFSDPTDQCELDSTNPTKSVGNQSCSQGDLPSYYIKITSADDVKAALKFAKENGIPLSIKNSGHDYMTRSTGKGTLSMWTRNLRGMSRYASFIPQHCPSSKRYDTIAVEAGVNFDEVYTFAETQNVTFIGGYATTVGVSGGWLQGGGHSVLSPVYGLGVDRVVEIKIVTPDGVLRTANECMNKDLFWALRGGGGGTFGVVLSSTHRVEPRMSVAVASISIPLTNAIAVPWLELLVNNSIRWGEEGWGGHETGNTLINMNPLLNLSAAQASVKAAVDFAAARNGTSVVEVLPSWYDVYKKYVIPSQHGVGSITILSSRLIPTDVFKSESGRVKLRDYFNYFLELGLNPYIPVTTPVLYTATENATSVTRAWRKALWHLSSGNSIKSNATLAERQAFVKRLNTLTNMTEELAPGGGAYVNEANPFTADWKDAWFGPNYDRLLSIKKQYDPHRLLNCWKCVGFDETEQAERFRCTDQIQNQVGRVKM